jgi:hypothetical protein
MATANFDIKAAPFLQIANLGAMPQEGPRTIPITLDFTIGFDNYRIDLTQIQRQHKFTVLQALFIDASNCPVLVTVTDGQINQPVVAQPNTQGFYPIMAGSPTVLIVSCPGGPAALKIYLINVPIAPAVWPT